MTAERITETDPRMQAAVAELTERLHARYPEATFTVAIGEDPEGVYLTPTVDVEDTDEVLDVVFDRLMELQIDEGLPLYVMPVLPLARVAEQLKARTTQRVTPAVSHPLQP